MAASPFFFYFCLQKRILKRSYPVIPGRVSHHLAGGEDFLAGGDGCAAAQRQDELLTVMQGAFVTELL